MIYLYLATLMSKADPDISIRGGGFKQENWISKQFVLRKIKRYRGVIKSENYKA